MTFVKRCTVERLLDGLILLHHWRSNCGRYRVTFSKYTGRGDMPNRWLACRHDHNGWDIITIHRKRETAEAACARHERDSR